MKRATCLIVAIAIMTGIAGRVARPAEPTTTPTTRVGPTTQELTKNVIAAQASLDTAAGGLKLAQADATVRLQKDPTYLKLLAAIGDATTELASIQSADTVTGKGEVKDATFQTLLAAVSAAAEKKASVREPDPDSPQARLDAAQARVDAAAALVKAQSDADKCRGKLLAVASANVDKAHKAADDFDAGFVAKDQAVVSATKAKADAADRVRSAQAALAKAEADDAAEAAAREREATAVAAAREREEAAREKAATIDAATPDQLKQAAVGGGKVSGAAWTVKNDATSSLLRGLPICIVEKETTAVPAINGVLRARQHGWEEAADFSNHLADDFRKSASANEFAGIAELNRDEASKYAADAANAIGKAHAIQAAIDRLSGTKVIDRRLALDLEAQYGGQPEVILGGAPSGCSFGSCKTNVDGKFSLDDVVPGDYYLISEFASSTLRIEWIIPIHVDAGKETIVELDNDNAAYIK